MTTCKIELKPEFKTLNEIHQIAISETLVKYNRDSLRMANENIQQLESKLNQIADLVEHLKDERLWHTILTLTQLSI